MAQSDEWEMIEDWFGLSPDEILEEIKQEAKKDIWKMHNTIDKLDKAVRSCQDWQRKNISLCPKCRARCSDMNKVNTKTERPPNKDKEHPEKQNDKSLVSCVSHFPVISKYDANKMKKKDSSTVFMSKMHNVKGAQCSTKMMMASEDFQIVLEAKNRAFEKLQQTTASESENLKMTIAKLMEQNEQLQSNASSTVSENENLKKENGKLKEKNEQLESTVSVNFRDLEKFREDTVLFKEKTQAEMRARSEEWEATQKELTKQITDLTDQLSKQKKQNGELENDLDKKDDELRMAKKELAEAKRPRVKDIVLGIRTERSGMGKTMIEMVNRELSGQLQDILGKENVRLTVKQCGAATDVPKGLMAVLCLDMSRVGTNIKDALAGIKVNRDVFVLVFHHTSKENLSSLTPTSLRITGSELRQLGAIIDMVFSSESDKKDDELRMVKKELAEAKRPRVKDIVLGIRCECSGMGKTMIEMVNRELSGQLQNILGKENVRLTVKQCAAATDVPKGLMAVLCLDMSRVGTNIKDALAGIKVNRDVFVIVFHHTSKENLSSLTPTSLRITGSELRQLGAIIDMVFSSDSGIYECDLNTTAIANIATLITKYS